MAKIVARNATIFGGGRDLSGRSNSATFSMSGEAPESTSFGAGTRERLPDGIKDTELSVDGFWDSAASQVDELFSSLLTGSAYFGFYPQSASAGRSGREVIGILTEYEAVNATEDAATTSMTATGSAAARRVVSHGYARVTGASSGSTALTSLDFSASDPSLWGFLRLLELSGTAASFSACIQESNDNNAFATIIVFPTRVTANSAEAASAVSASRYRRVKYAFAGTSPFGALFQVSTGS